MSHARFFLTSEYEPASPGLLSLTPEDAHHAARVLRVEPGEELDVVSPSGSAYRVEVVGISPEGVNARMLEQLEPSWYPQVTLIQGVAKGDKMDAIVRQAVEVGAAGVVPVLTSRSIVRLQGRKRTERGERWRRIAESASKQARRERVVNVADPVDFSEMVDLLGGFDHAIVLWEDHQDTLLVDAVFRALGEPDATLALIVGPEGGFSAEEVDALIQAGAVVASLGPSIMRTETAAVVSVAIATATAHQMRRGSER